MNDTVINTDTSRKNEARKLALGKRMDVVERVWRTRRRDGKSSGRRTGPSYDGCIVGVSRMACMVDKEVISTLTTLHHPPDPAGGFG